MAVVMNMRDGGGGKKKTPDLSDEIKRSASLAAQSQSSTMRNAQARQAQQSAAQASRPAGSGTQPAVSGSVQGVQQAVQPTVPLVQTTVPDISGYLTGYNPQPFTMSDYAREYRDRLAAAEADKPGDFRESDYTLGYRDKLAAAEADAPDPFKSRYSDAIDGILDTLQGRESFDPDSIYNSSLWKNQRDQYMLRGNQAMRDAQGAAAGLTGGYGSTYALAAGQQAYDQYLSGMNDMDLSIYDRLYQQYLDEGTEMYKKLQALNDQDAVDYGRYRDDVSDYQWGLGYLSDRYEQSRANDYQGHRDDVSDYQWGLGYLSDRYEQARANDYQTYQNDLAQQQWAEEYAYQRAQDALAQQNWQKQFDYQQQQDALAQQNWQTEFDYQKQKDAAAAAQRTASSSSGSTGKKSSSSAAVGYPYSNEYYGTLQKTVEALPTNAARFSYLYDVASTDDELEYLMNRFGVTPEAEPEEDEKTASKEPAQRKQNLLDALRGNIFAR